MVLAAARVAAVRLAILVVGIPGNARIEQITLRI
jgi:hypothetical protein